MAGKVLILTTNLAEDSWVDLDPVFPTTSYNHQNTNITARSLGMDHMSLYRSETDIILQPGGVVDSNGVPFVLSEEVSFLQTSLAQGANFFELLPGDSALDKDFALTTTRPEWSFAKNGYYSLAGNRVLNSVVMYEGVNAVVKVLPERNRENPVIVDVPEGLAGIGRGEKRVFPTVAQGSIYVAQDGIYEIFIIGGGQNVVGLNPGAGGSSALLQIRLLVGDEIRFFVGDKEQHSTAAVTLKFDMEAPTAAGTSSISLGSGVISVFENIQKGGAAGSGGGNELAGGGAGRYTNGGTGGSDFFGAFGVVRGKTMVEEFGRGANLSGSGIVDADSVHGYIEMSYIGA